MIVKVDLDLDCMTFGISNIRLYDPRDQRHNPDVEYCMVCYFDTGDVRAAFSKHSAPYMNADCVAVQFYDGREYIIDFHDENKMRNIEKFISHIFKMKMAGTKWEKEHPEQYI